VGTGAGHVGILVSEVRGELARSTSGDDTQFRPGSNLKTVPEPVDPPEVVVPYKLPSLACSKAPLGPVPSLGAVPKEYNTVSVPSGVIL
jgi:hypothetical protein